MIARKRALDFRASSTSIAGRAVARDDAHEIRRVDQPPRSGRGLHLASPEIIRDQLARADQAAAANRQPRGGPGRCVVVIPPDRRRRNVDAGDANAELGSAKYSEPFPRGRATRSIHCSRVSLTTCHRAFPGAQPIAQPHASIGAAPTRHNHLSPSMLAGPGPSRELTTPTPEPPTAPHGTPPSPRPSWWPPPPPEPAG